MVADQERSDLLSGLFRLDGKTALVTGCRTGLGKAMAVALAHAGADIVGVSSNLTRHASEVAREVEDLGRRFTAYDCDFGDRAALHAFLGELGDHGPRIDVLVNNAGVIVRKPAVEQTDADWDRVVEVDLNAQFVLAREIGTRMLAAGSGKIVFVASLLTFQGGQNIASYAAAKGAIGQLTKALANEWAASGVGVNAIAPGYMRTDLTQALHSDPERGSQILGRIPAGRWGEPQDLMGAIIFLASSASDYVHGTTICVDGGWLGR